MLDRVVLSDMSAVFISEQIQAYFPNPSFKDIWTLCQDEASFNCFYGFAWVIGSWINYILDVYVLN